MIEFRCWYCNRCHKAPKDRVGERITCHCGYPLRVPRRSGGKCRIKTPLDWLVQAVVYGGAGGLFGLGLDALLGSSFRFWMRQPNPCLTLVALPVGGVLIGFLGGERVVGWVAGIIRRITEE